MELTQSVDNHSALQNHLAKQKKDKMLNKTTLK